VSRSADADHGEVGPAGGVEGLGDRRLGEHEVPRGGALEDGRGVQVPVAGADPGRQLADELLPADLRRDGRQPADELHDLDPDRALRRRPDHRLQRAAPRQRDRHAVAQLAVQPVPGQLPDPVERVDAGVLGPLGDDRLLEPEPLDERPLQVGRPPGGIVDPDLDDAQLLRRREHPADVGAAGPQCARHGVLRQVLLVVQASSPDEELRVTRTWHRHIRSGRGTYAQ
jgi:hypothetical protein